MIFLISAISKMSSISLFVAVYMFRSLYIFIVLQSLVKPAQFVLENLNFGIKISSSGKLILLL